MQAMITSSVARTGPSSVVRATACVARLVVRAGGAALHVARTVCRRAERRMVSLEPPVDPVLLRYVNRLSDLLFVMARAANHRAVAPETEW